MLLPKDGNASSRSRKRKAATKKRVRVRSKKQMPAKGKGRVCARVETTLEKLDSKEGLPFEDLLSIEQITEGMQALGCEFRERVYSPWVTLWGFLSQVSSKDSSCKSAVMRIKAYRTLHGQGRCSAHASSYSQARHRLPEALYARLARDMGGKLDAQSRLNWLWKDRRVKIVDGTTVTMPDTPINQKAYPQSSGQKAGLGFPLMRITALFSLSVGTILDAELTSTKGKKTGEITAFRQLWRSLEAGDIVIGDCLYDGYSDIAQLKSRQVDIVFGMSQSRNRDFRQGKKLGPDDHVVTWKRPKFNKSRIDRETWEALPQEMEMREITTTIIDANNERRTITVVTTLLDSELYPKQEILELFRARWHCELDLRSVKTMMGMEHLSCRSPDMARKEVWTYFLAYNLIRCHMARAAYKHNVLPRKLSFNNARIAIETFTLAVIGVTPALAHEFYNETLNTIASHRVGNRPGRAEPRKVKRRNSKFPYLTKPRPKPQSKAAKASAP
jgi:hypothetical protein